MALAIGFEVLVEHIIIVPHVRLGVVLVLRHQILEIVVDPLMLDALSGAFEAESELLLRTQTLAIAILNVLSVEHALNLRPERLR